MSSSRPSSSHYYSDTKWSSKRNVVYINNRIRRSKLYRWYQWLIIGPKPPQRLPNPVNPFLGSIQRLFLPIEHSQYLTNYRLNHLNSNQQRQEGQEQEQEQDEEGVIGNNNTTSSPSSSSSSSQNTQSSDVERPLYNDQQPQNANKHNYSPNVSSKHSSINIIEQQEQQQQQQQRSDDDSSLPTTNTNNNPNNDKIINNNHDKLSKWYHFRTSIISISIFLIAWLIAFSVLVNFSYFASSISVSTRQDSNDTPFSLDQLFGSSSSSSTSPTYLSDTTSFWLRNDGCGINGQQCAPFNGSVMPFRCPSRISGTQLLNQRTIGDQQVIFQPLVVGGGDQDHTYRADSFICAAALHRGLISDSSGGCGILYQTGIHAPFISSNENGIESVRFDGDAFPSSFIFYDIDAPNSPFSTSYCSDWSYPILAFNVVMLVIFTLLFPFANSGLLYAVSLCVGYWHISLVSDSRDFPPSISQAFGDFLPTLFVLYVFWRMAYRYVLPAFISAPLERTILFFGPFWVGILENLTFDKIPVDRLTANDINKRPGGLIAVIIIAVICFILAINQIRVIRKTGWLPKYLSWYILGGILCGILASLPDMTFRLHHYIIAMAVIPATAFPTRLSLILQGLMLGLFLNGVGRWSYDSIVQTTAELRDDAALGTGLPNFVGITQANQTNVILSWEPINNTEQESNSGSTWDGFALIVNDVLRYQSLESSEVEVNLADLDWGTRVNFSQDLIQTNSSSSSNVAPNRDMYFRLAYQSNGESGDFTKAATWKAETGEWIPPESGPGG